MSQTQNSRSTETALVTHKIYGVMGKTLRDWSRWKTYNFTLKTYNPATKRMWTRTVEVFTPFKEAAAFGVGQLPGETLSLQKPSFTTFVNNLIAPKKLQTRELAAFFEAMAIGIERSASPGAALEAAARVVRTPVMRGHIAALRHLMAGGYQLSQAMALLPGFSRMHMAITQAGEKTADGLSGNYYSLAKRLQSSSVLTRKLISNLIYPAIALTFTIVTACYMAIGVVPKFASLYKDMGADLPTITKVFQSFGELVLANGVVTLVTLISSSVAAVILGKLVKKTVLYDRLLLGLPFLGQVVAQLALMRALQVYALLRQAGLASSEVYGLAGEAAGNRIVKDFFDSVYSRVHAGLSVEQAMAREWPRLGPEGVILAGRISIGNKSGKTSTVIETLAGDYESRAESTLAVFPQIISVPVMVLMGAILMPTILAITLPLPNLIMRQLQTMAKPG